MTVHTRCFAVVMQVTVDGNLLIDHKQYNSPNIRWQEFEIPPPRGKSLPASLPKIEILWHLRSVNSLEGGTTIDGWKRSMDSLRWKKTQLNTLLARQLNRWQTEEVNCNLWVTFPLFFGSLDDGGSAARRPYCIIAEPTYKTRSLVQVYLHT